MAWTADITWATGQLVSSTKLTQMVENGEWARGMADRKLVHSFALMFPRITEGSDSISNARVTITANGSTKQETGFGLKQLVDMAIQTAIGGVSHHLNVGITVEVFQGSGWRTWYQDTIAVVNPNESGLVRYDNLTVVSDVASASASWTDYSGDPEGGDNTVSAVVCHLAFWVHNNDWAEAWSPYV